MIDTKALKVELAQLQKRKNMLAQQREQVTSAYHGTLGAISELEKLVKQSEEEDKTPVVEGATTTDTPPPAEPPAAG